MREARKSSLALGQDLNLTGESINRISQSLHTHTEESCCTIKSEVPMYDANNFMTGMRWKIYACKIDALLFLRNMFHDIVAQLVAYESFC